MTVKFIYLLNKFLKRFVFEPKKKEKVCLVKKVKKRRIVVNLEYSRLSLALSKFQVRLWQQRCLLLAALLHFV